jgi:carbonic anhydrase/acetyltransferase-like protein (isoleucine patch superfamily)
VPWYALGDLQPTVHPDAFVHPDAVLIGDVRIGADSSIWPGAVLRGDEGHIEIGRRTSVQDNCVLHTTPMWPTVVGDDCVIGHLVHLEGCTIQSGVLVGNASVVLHRVVVESGAIVAANAVVLNDTVVPAGALAVGTPATLKPGRARPEEITRGVQSYLERTRRYRAEMRQVHP